MTQKNINSSIDKLFDDFVKADYDINKMDDYLKDESNNESTKKFNNKNVDVANNTININDNDTINDAINDTINDKTNFTDDSLILDMSDSFSGELLNNYTEYYKKRTNKGKNFTLLDGIDKNDPYSTNMPLEELYFEMTLYLENETQDPDFCKIIPYNEIDQNIMSSDELYCILLNGSPLVVSKSLFSLLIELTSIKLNDKNKGSNNYDIINLK